MPWARGCVHTAQGPFDGSYSNMANGKFILKIALRPQAWCTDTAVGSSDSSLNPAMSNSCAKTHKVASLFG